MFNVSLAGDLLYGKLLAGDVFVLCFFPRDVLDEILDLIEPVSEGFPTYRQVRQVLKNFFGIKENVKDTNTAESIWFSVTSRSQWAYGAKMTAKKECINIVSARQHMC